jgi:hypothetical protein
MFLGSGVRCGNSAGVVAVVDGHHPGAKKGNDHGNPHRGDPRRRGLRPLPLYADTNRPLTPTRVPARSTGSRLGGVASFAPDPASRRTSPMPPLSTQPEEASCPTSRTPLLAERTYTWSSPPTGYRPTAAPRPSSAVGVDCCSKVIPPCTQPPDRTGGCAHHVEPSCSAATPTATTSPTADTSARRLEHGPRLTTAGVPPVGTDRHRSKT